MRRRQKKAASSNKESSKLKKIVKERDREVARMKAELAN